MADADDYPGFHWLRDNWESLSSYNFEWVAVTKVGLIAHNADLTEVIRQVGQRSESHAVYAFVDFVEVGWPTPL